jgi:NAD(P)-dependent dehydrogenase (short-subunit alcohol dehydrogenase family)
MSADFAGKVAVVAGGSLGIGKSAATQLGLGRATVILCGNEDGPVVSTTTELRQAGIDAYGFTVDVTRAADVERLMADAERVGGGIDILINSAGIQRYGTVVETTEDEWDHVLAVNLKSMFLTSKFAIPYMRKRGSGSIVHVSSVQAFHTQEGVAAYAASKGGVVSLTTAMAVDHARDGIRVNAVCPGSVDTPMLRASARRFAAPDKEDDLIAHWGRSHLLGRVARPEEIAEAIAFLAGNASSFMTGSVLLVDGGLSAQLGATTEAR